MVYVLEMRGDEFGSDGGVIGREAPEDTGRKMGDRPVGDGAARESIHPRFARKN